MSRNYKLVNKEAVPCNSTEEWARSFDSPDRIVAKTDVGESTVSTVFLGLDHNFGDGPPLLFETMVFGGPEDDFCDRYTTWEQAEKGHAEVCERLASATRGSQLP